MIKRLQQLPCLRGALLCLVSAVFTLCRCCGGQAPFALGLLAAAGMGGEGKGIAIATALTAMVFLPFSAAAPHLACVALIATAAVAFRPSSLLSSRKSTAAVSAAVVLSVGGIYVVQSFDPLGTLPPYLACAALTAAGAWWFFPLAGGRWERQSILFLCAALAVSLGQGNALALTGAGVLASLGGVSAEGALGLGLLWDLAMGTADYTAPFALLGLALALTAGRAPLLRAVLSFAAMILTDLSIAPVAGGIAITSLLLPRRMLRGKRVQTNAPADPAPVLAAAWKRRAEGAAAALRELYDSLSRPAHGTNEENPAIVFDRAAERTCRDCALCELCWQQDYTSTFNALNDATASLLERGRALPKDFPPHFANRCIHLTDFLAAVNGELSAFLLRRQYRRQLEETRRTARGQYAQLSELLTATAAGLGENAPAPHCRIGAALRPREGERVCGDTLVSFPTEEGKWCLILSDGMGSGEEARKESALVCRLLRQFLESGIAPEAALKTLNAAMALRGAESGSFTTLDLCVYDAAAGEADLYKYGAAPSYLKKGGMVRRIAGTSLPVGLKGAPAPPDVTKVPLTAGSFLVMVSDGVADPTRDEWLQDLLAGWQGEDPQSLAGLILTESISRLAGRDDCGIQILYCPREEVQEV